MANNLPLKLATIALFLAVEVVLMGGFTRITDSGLGCPDWPGCFGKMAMTTDTETIAHLQERYPEIHVAVHKGWIEMIHRYIAGGLGLLIMGDRIPRISRKRKNTQLPLFGVSRAPRTGHYSRSIRCVHSDAEVIAEYCHTPFDGWTDHRLDPYVFA